MIGGSGCCRLFLTIDLSKFEAVRAVDLFRMLLHWLAIVERFRFNVSESCGVLEHICVVYIYTYTFRLELYCVDETIVYVMRSI